ncbi:MAG: LysR family transcriptional regulator [Myxococcaceae bacterium]|nr:LysR family transcriptional regulator [Myxococcaceae bacterium]
MDTDRIVSFSAAAAAGSLSRAARRLGLPLSSVSRRITELERELGAKLFERTGRGVRLTPKGERFLARARGVLQQLELARAEVRSGAPPAAPLRLSVPPDFGLCVMPPVLSALAARFPLAEVHVRGDVRRVSLAEESFDAAVRLGKLGLSELIARRIGTVSLGLYAAPGLAVKTVDELAARDTVLVDLAPAELAATERGRAVKLRLSGRFKTGTFLEAAELAALGDRIALLPSFVAAPFVETGRLERAGPWRLASVPIHLLCTQRHRGSKLLDALATLLEERLARLEQGAS